MLSATGPVVHRFHGLAVHKVYVRDDSRVCRCVLSRLRAFVEIFRTASFVCSLFSALIFWVYVVRECITTLSYFLPSSFFQLLIG